MNCIYDNNYLVYNDGRIYSKKSNRFLNGWMHKDGYRHFNISGNYYLGHRLVALHYIDNPHNYDQVNHIDGNKLNNDITNLEWCNQIQNLNAYKSLYKNNKSGHKNICSDNQSKQWIFYKRYYRKYIKKRFTSKIDALCYKYIILLRIKAGHFN